MNRHLATAESEDYDLEYRASEDDAWYSVYVVFDVNAEKLTVKFCSSPEEYKVVFNADEFATAAEVDELTRRFRPVSLPLEDHECRKLLIGTTVCAAHAVTDDDLRFYDAVIEAVKRRAHLFVNGEEECLCNFVLFWKNGRGRGTLTTANIASICIAEPATQLDPRISAFAVMAKKKITSSNSIFTKKKSAKSSQNRPLEMRIGMMQKGQMLEIEGSEKISNYNAWTSQDEDMGSGCNTEFILICNLENDLTPSSIKDFIYKQTSILPQAFIFPRLLSDPFTRGVIMVDSEKKVQIIYEFLENPNHIVVSLRGRPWVITEKASVGTFGANIWNLIPMDMDEIKYKRTDAKRTDEELHVVLSGTESYNRAKQLKDLLVEYIHRESLLCKKLVLEEQKIWQSCQPA